MLRRSPSLSGRSGHNRPGPTCALPIRRPMTFPLLCFDRSVTLCKGSRDAKKECHRQLSNAPRVSSLSRRTLIPSRSAATRSMASAPVPLRLMAFSALASPGPMRISFPLPPDSQRSWADAGAGPPRSEACPDGKKQLQPRFFQRCKRRMAALGCRTRCDKNPRLHCIARA